MSHLCHLLNFNGLNLSPLFSLFQRQFFSPIRYGLKGMVDVTVEMKEVRGVSSEVGGGASRTCHRVPLELKTGKVYCKQGTIEHRAQVICDGRGGWGSSLFSKTGVSSLFCFPCCSQTKHFMPTTIEHSSTLLFYNLDCISDGYNDS